MELRRKRTTDAATTTGITIPVDWEAAHADSISAQLFSCLEFAEANVSPSGTNGFSCGEHREWLF